MDSTSSQGIGYKTQILIGCTASGQNTVIYHRPHVPRQEEVQQNIDAECSTYSTYLLCTPTSITPAAIDGGSKSRISRRFRLPLSKMETTPTMNLTPIGNPAHETIRGVRFAMLGGAGFVVTNAALEEIEAPRPQKDGYLGRFGKHRNKFEQIASSKHQRGQVRFYTFQEKTLSSLSGPVAGERWSLQVLATSRGKLQSSVYNL